LIKNLLRLLALIETWLPTDTALQLAVRRNLPPTGFLGEKLAVTPLVFGCHLRINFIKNLSKGSSSQREREKKKVNGRRGLSFIFSFAALQGDSICSMIGSFSIS